VDGQRVWSKSVERIAGGEWRIGPVAIGQTWSVHALGHVEGSGPGPSRAFEEVVFDLAAAPPENLFVVRLQMPDGTPCADALVMQGVTRGDQRITLTRTDGDGLLRTSEPLWRRDCEAVEFAVLDRRVQGFAICPAGTPWFLEAEDGSQARVRDLGVVRLAPATVLARGCVVDANTGRPLVAEFNAADASWWIPNGRTDPCGNFEVWASPNPRAKAPDAFACPVHAGAHGSVTMVVARGDLQAVVEMTPRRSVDCSVLLDRNVAVYGLVASLEPGGDCDSCTAGRAGRAEFSLDLGPRDARPQSLRITDTAHLFEFTTVPASEWRTTDAGFAVEVDLRGKLTSFDIRTDIPLPRRADHANTLYVRRLGDTGPWHGIRLSSNAAFAAPVGARYEMLVDASGWRRTVHFVPMPGITRIDTKPFVVELDVHADGIDRDALRVKRWCLDRREPFLDDVERTREPARSWTKPMLASLPPSLADLATLGSTHGWRLDGPTTRLELGWRGKHLLVPCIVDGNEERPIVEASVVVEVSDAIDTVRATIHVNAGQVRTRK
ncbi:MAG TPA: hypothetical protein VFT55_14240, partial [Planctomycetota bacterium]|nr:hypothetical protein [Planctomycetota bacterium]